MKKKVGNICKTNASTLSRKDDFEEILYLDTANITKNKIDEIQKIAVSQAPSRAQRKVKNNTIIYSTVRPNLEHFGILENPQENFIVSTGFSTLDVVDKNISPKYLYYLLTQKHITNYLHTIATNAVSAYPSINSDDISDLVFDFPDNPIQLCIIAVLSALDDKIALNNRINDNLEAMAKTIYDYWFVQNADEKWEKKEIEDYIPSSGGFAFKSTEWINKGISVIKIKDIQEDNTLNFNDMSKVSEETIVDDKFIANTGEVVIAMTGATIGKVAVVPYHNHKIFVNQRVGIFKSANPIGNLPFLINSLKQPYIRESIFSISGGAAQPNISNEQINTIQLTMPDNNLIERYNHLMKPLYMQILKNQQQNQHLTQLRDWLLPMLMNGQVSVNYHLSDC